MPTNELSNFVMPYTMASQQELTDLTKRELEASKQIIDKLTRIIEYIMTKQTDENFATCADAVRKENTALKKRIAEIKQLMENDLVVVTRKKDFQIKELQSKLEQTVSEKEMIVNETKCMVNKLEKRCEDYEKKEKCSIDISSILSPFFQVSKF